MLHKLANKSSKI